MEFTLNTESVNMTLVSVKPVSVNFTLVSDKTV